MLAMLALTMFGAVTAPAARAQDGNANRKTVLTFSKPFEVPGHVLPAGTYTFQLADTLADRHIVSISSADGKEQIAMVMGIEINRVDAPTKTVITFNEVPVGQPDAIRSWFYPGRSTGVELVYPKRRALALAALAKVIVPAVDDDVAEPELKTARVVAVTPEQREVPVATVFQAPVLEGTRASAELPRTASSLYLALAAGLLSLWAAGALLFLRPGAAKASTV